MNAITLQRPEGIQPWQLLEKARSMLAEADTLDKLRAAQHMAEDIVHISRTRDLSAEMVQDAKAIGVRAEWKIGRKLRELPGPTDRENGAAGGHIKAGSVANMSGILASPTPKKAVLRDLNISPIDASAWERISFIPEERLEAFISEWRREPKGITRKAAIKQGETFISEEAPKRGKRKKRGRVTTPERAAKRAQHHGLAALTERIGRAITVWAAEAEGLGLSDQDFGGIVGDAVTAALMRREKVANAV